VATRGVVPFGEQSWEQEADGVTALVCNVDGARWAIVEYAPGAGRPEFCEVGHEGYVISGEIEYEFSSGGTITASAGQGFRLPGDDPHRGFNHGSEPARLLVIDDVE
jgi:quercetin dioxygenase-like cupin family protein